MGRERASRAALIRVLLIGAGALLLVLFVLPLVGSVSINYARALRGESPDAQILWQARVPRVLLSLLVGGVLATGGVLFQALLRDSLATPFTLGVSSGASLGAVLAIVLGWAASFGYRAIWLTAFAGAAVTLLLVMSVASQGRRLSSFTLLLAGVTMNSMATALILFLHTIADFSQSFAIGRWLMGGIEPVSYTTLAWLAVTSLPVVIWLFWRARDWNLLAVGEEWAEARGVSVASLMRGGYFAGSFLTAAVTSFTGPIGFIGLIVPHGLRLLIGADHRILFPASFLYGAIFLAVCDTIARTVLTPAEIPVGVITAFIGGPFFIWMLRSRRRSLWL